MFHGQWGINGCLKIIVHEAMFIDTFLVRLHVVVEWCNEEQSYTLRRNAGSTIQAVTCALDTKTLFQAMLVEYVTTTCRRWTGCLVWWFGRDVCRADGAVRPEEKQSQTSGCDCFSAIRAVELWVVGVVDWKGRTKLKLPTGLQMAFQTRMMVHVTTGSRTRPQVVVFRLYLDGISADAAKR